IRIAGGAYAFDEWIPKGDRGTEAVKKRKRGEEHVVLSGVEHHRELRDVPEDIAMTEHHALWFAGTSAREKQERFGMIADARKFQQTRQNRGGHRQSEKPPAENLWFHRRQDFVEMEDLRCPGKIFEPLRHLASRDDRAQTTLLLRGFDRIARAGEVHIHRNLAGEQHREVGDNAAFSRRKDDADSLLGTILFQNPAESERRAEKFPARQSRVVEPIRNRDAKAISLQSAETGAREMAAQDRPLAVAKFADLQQLFADGGDVRFGHRQRLSKRDCDAVRQRPRPFREEASALEREDRAPEPVEPNGNNGRFRLARDDFIAAS